MTRVRSLAGGLEPVCWPTVPADCRGELISENSIDKLVSGVGKKSESVCADMSISAAPTRAPTELGFVVACLSRKSYGLTS
jgi:hypothetical protein